jgi:hypothetical protein
MGLRPAEKSADRSYLLERSVCHSIRANGGDGVLLPYHDLLSRCEKDTISTRAIASHRHSRPFESLPLADKIALSNAGTTDRSLRAHRLENGE